jgi:hypothetical protein
MITSVIDRQAGFFSTLFFAINNYLFAINNNLNFKLDTSNWVFRSKLGWEDYFLNIDILDKAEPSSENIILSDFVYSGIYNLHDYRIGIQKIYKYNDNVKNMIENKKKELNLPDNYCSIFIRRGDKLFEESLYISSYIYIKNLLIINPNCNTIFLQTDDYNCYLDILEYIKINNLNIKVVCLCKEKYKGGMVIFNECDKIERSVNKDYLCNYEIHLKNNKPINELNSEEMFEHVTDMIIGIDIILNSSLVVCEYSSNVARFIKLAHKNPKCVFNINSLNCDIDWNAVKFPAYSI